MQVQNFFLIKIYYKLLTSVHTHTLLAFSAISHNPVAFVYIIHAISMPQFITTSSPLYMSYTLSAFSSISFCCLSSSRMRISRASALACLLAASRASAFKTQHDYNYTKIQNYEEQGILVDNCRMLMAYKERCKPCYHKEGNSQQGTVASFILK